MAVKFVYVVRSLKHGGLSVSVGTNFKWAYDQAKATIEDCEGTLDLTYAQAQKACKQDEFVLLGKAENIEANQSLVRIESTPMNPDPDTLKKFFRKCLDILEKMGYGREN